MIIRYFARLVENDTLCTTTTVPICYTAAMHTLRHRLFAFVCCIAWLVDAGAVWTAHHPPAAALPTPTQVETNYDKAAVHTRLSGVADDAYLDTQLTLVAEMGAPWIVELFPWAYAQPRSAYGYDWSGFDRIVDRANNRGLQIIARLDIVPAWARPADSTDRLLPPHAYTAYRDYVVAFAIRYYPRGVHHIVVWNEPNLRFEWGGRPPDPEAYAALLAAVAPAVKAVTPEMQVIAGGLSPGASLGDEGAIRLDDRSYTERFVAAGGAAHIDGWAVHAYGAQRPPNDPPHWDVVNLRRVELVQQLFAGPTPMPIYITEAGWNDHPRWQSAVSAAERIRWSRGAFRYAQTIPWIRSIALWQFGLPAPTRTYQDGWLIVAGDGTPRAIYYELQALLRGGE